MKKIYIDNKEVSVSEALCSRIYYRALDIDGIFEPEARKVAHETAEEKCDIEYSLFAQEMYDMTFLNSYLEAAENDLMIDSDEVERKENIRAKSEKMKAEADFFEYYTNRGL